MKKNQLDLLNRPLLLRLSDADMTQPLTGAVDVAAGPVRFLEASAAEDGTPKLPTYEMTVYTGGEVYVGYYGRTVIDLDGLVIPEGPVLALRDHDPNQEVGHGRARREGNTILASGVISGNGEHVERLIANLKNGMPYQSSIGVRPAIGGWEEVEPGEKVTVNGQEFTGPLLVLRRGTHHEHSFVPFGADPNTSSKVAAKMAQKEKDMDPEFKKWLEAKGWSSEGLSISQIASLQAAWKTETAAPATVGASVPAVDPAVEAARQAERQRVVDITAACAGDWGASAPQVAAIRDAALADGTSVSTVNAKILEVVRASRPAVSSRVDVGPANLSEDTMQAALCLAAGMPTERARIHCGERAVMAAGDLRRMRLREFLAFSARVCSGALPSIVGDGMEYLGAAVSITGIKNILVDAMNKILVEEYANQTSTWRHLAETQNVSDFKAVKRIDLFGTGDWKRVGPDGKLAEGDLGDSSYSIMTDTLGQYIGLGRQDVVNDDLGALFRITKLMTSTANSTLDNMVVVDTLLANTSSFFGSDHGNYEAGAGTALATDGVALADQKAKYRLQKTKKTDKDTKEVATGLVPNVLVVPPQLEHTAQILMTASSLSTANNDANPHKGMLEVVSPWQLGETTFTGSSATAWYLFNSTHKPFVMAFLNGVQTPTITGGVNQDPRYLGFTFSGYIDANCNYGNYRYARKIKGAAA